MTHSHNRFQIASDNAQMDADDTMNHHFIRNTIATAANDIESMIPPSRERSLAVTKLEEALLWAGKAIFNPTLAAPATERTPS